uniref:transposase n=1 Tax=Streptomyces europaeiscabiei TaxID=146819 RepID=UPI0038D471BB
MTNDVDTLATALYAAADDMLKEHPDLAPWRPPVGITLRLSDAELVTLATMQAILGYTSEATWLRHARAHLRHLFPCLPPRPGYNKRLNKAAGPMRSVNRILATTSVWSDDVWVVDSTPVECGRSRETVKRSDLAGWAEYDYCASHSRFFWGLRLHLVCTLHGLPIAFALTGAKDDERETLSEQGRRTRQRLRRDTHRPPRLHTPHLDRRRRARQDRSLWTRPPFVRTLG